MRMRVRVCVSRLFTHFESHSCHFIYRRHVPTKPPASESFLLPRKWRLRWRSAPTNILPTHFPSRSSGLYCALFMIGVMFVHTPGVGWGVLCRLCFPQSSSQLHRWCFEAKPLPVRAANALQQGTRGQQQQVLLHGVRRFPRPVAKQDRPSLRRRGVYQLLQVQRGPPVDGGLRVCVSILNRERLWDVSIESVGAGHPIHRINIAETLSDKASSYSICF